MVSSIKRSYRAFNLACIPHEHQSWSSRQSKYELWMSALKGCGYRSLTAQHFLPYERNVVARPYLTRKVNLSIATARFKTYAAKDGNGC